MRQRKKIRLEGYDYSQPGYYFVTICTQNRAHILGSIVVGADVLIGPRVALSEIGHAVRDVILTMPSVDQYVIMPNHLHLIFHLPESANGPMRTSAPTTSVPALVRYLKRSVTISCGFSIWQISYHDHIIRDESEYLRICEYIETNPARWREDIYYAVPKGEMLL